MDNYMTTKEAAARWGISMRRINILCQTGRIPGAYKSGRSWRLPIDAKKPKDERYKRGTYSLLAESMYVREQGSYQVLGKRNKRLPLPVGISDYRKACSMYYYVDKTLLIRDFIDELPQVSLFTRPRRFGKTLNMDMLRVYFEKSDEDTSIYFRDKKIWACGEEYRAYQGKYPVIYVTFKDVKADNWENAYSLITMIIRNEFERHSELLESDSLSSYEKEYYKKILALKADKNDMAFSFLNLSRFLHLHCGIAPIIIVDEYDTPIAQGHMRGYYDEAIDFMRALFSGGLKDNPHLSFGFMTGILRVAKESIFSGLNNLKINSVLDNRYSGYFGFTPDEVMEMAAYYGASEKYDEICRWYDGYRFGNTEIFNPWSVIGYFNNECMPQAFWQATGSNDIIQEVLENADEEIYEKLEALMQGKSFMTHIDTSVVYPQIKNNPSSVYSFLLVAGYLKAVSTDRAFGGDYMCEVALPNREISYVYSKEILRRIESVMPISTTIAVQEAIYAMDSEALQRTIEKYLIRTISFYDGSGEAFYHGLLLGLCAMLDQSYRITSNRESGYGRFDICLTPTNPNLPGILIEIKAGRDCTEKELENLSEQALAQIVEKKYDTDMKAAGVQKILLYGMAFSGKKVCIRQQYLR